ncbi:hypothetical protein TNIN_267351 [Trichonephila inaurata madagascariensis]|uniref:RNA-directed DNA polymerase from mobile element jockey n=1 Tax=Trichonephila inaurata madagascariensis TaxID=2747483 RepID=A0A8X6IET0_9ARAC|nr:hypothetical protein TNIN_267351 [Trichonephila inaurata madagascariensis]
MLSRNSKRQIYQQYLQPILTYACQIWGCAASYNINKLQVLQNRALRIILNYPYYIARKYLHRDARIQPLNGRITDPSPQLSIAKSVHIQIQQSPIKSK